MKIEQTDWFPDARRAIRSGCRVEGGGVHASKTMMLPAASILLAQPAVLNVRELRRRVLDENILSMGSLSARLTTFCKLVQLYGLNTASILTRGLITLWPVSTARPMLAIVCAVARDPLLRVSAAAIFNTKVGERVSSHEIRSVLEVKLAGRFRESTMAALAQRCVSSWAQAGYVTSGPERLRQRAVADPHAAAYAALVAIESGFVGQSILASPWLELLDVEPTIRLRAGFKSLSSVAVLCGSSHDHADGRDLGPCG
jgi:hypothetical protein